MNSYTERIIGTIRRGALDHFLLFLEKQMRNITNEYVDYYNNFRPHQGHNDIPNKFTTINYGKIKKQPILSGLHHYYRSSA